MPKLKLAAVTGAWTASIIDENLLVAMSLPGEPAQYEVRQLPVPAAQVLAIGTGPALSLVAANGDVWVLRGKWERFYNVIELAEKAKATKP